MKEKQGCVLNRKSLIKCLFILLLVLLFPLYPRVSGAVDALSGEIITVEGGITGTGREADGPFAVEGWPLVEDYWHELERELGDYLPAWSIHDIWRREGDKFFPGMGELFSGLVRYLLKEVLANIRLMGQLLLLAVAASLLKSLQGAFGSREVARMTEAVIFFVLLGLALGSFSLALKIGREAVDNMVNFMLALLPVLLTLMASLGHVTSAALFHPLIIVSVNLMSSLVRNVFFPLIFFSTILYLLNHFSPDFRIDRLASFLKDASIWGIGLMLTIFVGITGVHGVAGGIGDAVSLRTAKFMTGTFIPVVGRAMADAVETVLGYSLLLKNSATLAGLVILALTIIFPLLKLLALVIIYKFSGALVQPLGENSLAAALDTMGNCLTMVFAAVATVALSFFIGITIIVGASNAVMMLR
ncbi:MAG: stage III sporulation protein AE [Bacillota bacterium]